jgi:U3 small nucleolar RNA-associated protein 15
VLTCSDDTTVKVWDVPSQSAITTFTSHTDYVRSGQFSTANPHLIFTGSYDSTIRLFDARSGECEMVMGRGGTAGSGGVVSAPVEQVLVFPSDTVALSSAGPILRVWDVVAGGRCIRAMSNHQKTVTALAFDANAGRLLTGGLDHLVKLYDVSTYKVVHTMRYPAPILCLAVSVCRLHILNCALAVDNESLQPDETHIAAGMSDGTLSVRRRQSKASEADQLFSAAALKSGAFESFLGGALPNIGEGRVKEKRKVKATPDLNEFRVESRRTKRLREYDRLLKGFKYSAALDSVLRKVRPTTCFCVQRVPSSTSR